ncbi:MAG: DMT family transporter [Acidobacteriaceae bacterium]
MSRSAKAHLLLVLITLIWGSTFVLVKGALQDASPLLFNAIRFTIAGAVLAGIYWRSAAALSRRDLTLTLPVGVFLFAGYAFQTTGLRYTTPSKSGFITGVSVVLVPLFQLLLFRRKLDLWAAVGAVLAVVGLALLAVPAGQRWSALAAISYGDWLTLGCAVAFALHIIFLGRASERSAFQSVAILQTTLAALLMWISVPLLELPQILWSGRVLLAIIITAIFATAIAFSVQSWAQQFTPANHAALIFSLEPVFAMGSSYLLIHERLGQRAVWGCVSILAGVLIGELMPQRNRTIRQA